MSRLIHRVIVHCSDSEDGLSVPVEDIDRWHIKRGFKRFAGWRKQKNAALQAIGYHFVIDIDGSIHTGRAINEVGAHCKGHNFDSVGICMIGRSRFSRAQWTALESLYTRICNQHGALVWHGHREYDRAKTCPNFDVAKWVQAGLKPLPKNVLGA